MRRTTVKLVVVLSVVTVLAIVLYAVLFGWVRTINVSVGELSSELAFQVDKEARLKSVEELVRDTQEERESLERRFIDEQQVVDVITLLESLGATAQADLEVISVQVAQDVGNTDQELELSLKVGGSWQSVYHLLSLIETTPHALTVDRLQLREESSRAGTEEEGAVLTTRRWSGNIEVTVLMQGQPT